MIVYSCDRCGKSNGKIPLSVVTVRETGYTKEHGQICHECKLKLIKWIAKQPSQITLEEPR